MKISAKISFLILFIFTLSIFTFVVLKLFSGLDDKRDKQAVSELSALQGAVSTIEVNFKTQVQEWKNILLRGHNPDDLEKYRSQFLERDNAVRAAAVEEQNTTTTEINRTVDTAVNQNATISQVIDKVAHSAEVHRDSAMGIQAAATELSSMAGKLQSSVSRFVHAA